MSCYPETEQDWEDLEEARLNTPAYRERKRKHDLFCERQAAIHAEYRKTLDPALKDRDVAYLAADKLFQSKIQPFIKKRDAAIAKANEEYIDATQQFRAEYGASRDQILAIYHNTIDPAFKLYNQRIQALKFEI